MTYKKSSMLSGMVTFWTWFDGHRVISRDCCYGGWVWDIFDMILQSMTTTSGAMLWPWWHIG